jgi:amino acid adenylation domain-containing protein/non-ribosomal peptide synthase protein (TIGR01720 family)
MSRKNIENIHSLSPMQQGILFHALYDPHPALYLVTLAWTLRGPLDAGALARAFQAVADRHTVLRTCFAWERLPRPLQIVRKQVRLTLEEHDLSALPPDARPDAARRIEEDLAGRGFDLTRAPLLRLALVRLAPDTHRLIWASHHLILDGWSLPIVVREAFAVYDALAAGREPQLDRPRPYGDFVAWLSAQDPGAAERFWRAQLRGFHAPTPFRVDRTDGGEAGFDERTLLLPERDADAALARARRHQITPSTLVQGAWALLLARYSGEREVLFGATVSGRSAPVPGIERMVGLFINTLPVRVEVPPDEPALPWLRRLQDHMAELRDHEHSPLVDVQGWSEVPRGVPLFESQVAFENYPDAETLLESGAGLRVVEARMGSQAHYPLTFTAAHRRTLGLRIGHDRARFDGATVDRMLRHLATLIASIAADFSHAVGDLPMLPEAERAQLLAGNDTPAPFPAACVHRLFEEQADRTPDAIALVAGEERLTFRALASRARRLARRLRAIGVGPDAVVGLCLGRSAAMIVGILGVLEAGGAYLPLDPGDPPLRLAALRDEAGARVIVTGAAHAHVLAGEGVHVVRLDADAAALAAEDDAPLLEAPAPSSLAYVLFTSGSTGKPKAVAVSHASLAHYVRAVAARLDLPPGARCAHVSTFSADLGHTALFPPLCLGGELHVVPEEVTTDPQALGRAFEREAIDCTKIVPSHLAALLSGARPERVLPRRVLVLGGERLPWDLVARVEALAPGTRILNHYGPTETTVGATTFAVPRGRRVPGTPIVPLGLPLAGVRAHVVDPRLALAPTGVPGELILGGPGVARGYLGRPDLTAERFLPDPFVPGERVYRTGDRARRLDDGTLVFLGRADDQIKIRGHRVEIGEIEAAILACPGVAQAAVLAREGDRLAAYVAAAGGAGVAEIRAFLEARLPAHMVPASITALAALPLTPNGKVDRRALAAMEDDRAGEEATAYVAPRTPVEEVLAGIWCDVLGRDRVGVHDRFADLGGHSLLAIQIIARARDAFQADVPLRALFESPTIAGLAGPVEAALRRAEPPPPPIARVPRGGPLALSFAQERLWFLHQLDPESPLYNVPSAIRVAGRLDVAALERAIRDVVRRHEVLRTTFEAVDGKPVQIVHEEADVRLPVVRWPDLAPADREEAARREAAAEARRPFDLAAGPLMRARLLEIDEEDHLLLLTLHHIVSDGSTRGILSREIGALYAAHATGAALALPDLPVQYADFAAWQRGWLSGDVLDRQLAYWKQQLDGAPRVIDLPTDHPRPPVPSYRGAQQIRILSPEIARGLDALARREGATLYMTLLAALAVLLHRWTGQRDVVVGTSVTNRSRPEVEPLVGFFVNALVLRVPVDPDRPFGALLARARETCLGAYAHQDLPFERLVQEIAPDPDPSRAPLFQVIFTMQNAPAPPARLPGLAVRPAPAPSTTVKYDLTFVMGPLENGGLGVSIEHSVDLFEDATVERMIGHLATLLDGIARDADRTVEGLPMISEEELRLVVAASNGAAPVDAANACIHELFEARVDRDPEAVAVVSGAARLTFRELDARANRIARRLRALGVGPDSVVGVCLPRSVDLVAALLGVLEAGGAYLPLDPAHPPQRLAQLAGDAGARVIVTVDALAGALPPAALVRLDADDAAIARESGERLDGWATPRNLAYVLFTSGSTGRPKGVAVEHENLVQYVRGVARRLGLHAGARYAHVSTFSADLGNTVLFPSLCLGGTLHVIPEDLATDPAGLGAYFAEHGIDCLKIVPSHLSALLAGPHPERVLPRALLVLGGEASSWDLVERVHALAPGLRVLNHYGPTETTVGVATFALERGRRVEGSPTVPLGRPLPGAQIHVLDAGMRPAPLGVPGEIFIGGAGVARGYLGRPDLTADRFVPDPFRGQGARLYRTGDRARWLPDGTLVFLGRVDLQVKVRGHRVEIGEIEAALAAEPGVRAAAVIAREDAPGDVRLVACVVPADGARDGALDLPRRLAERLPGYLVPSSFVALDALPLTPNGKVDRGALAKLAAARDDAGDHVAPRTPTEEVLAGIWADVFGRDRVGVHDRFGDLGGHSLLAVQIIARARAAFGVEVPLRAVFEAPTVAGLAERVEAAVRAGDPPPPPLGRVARAPPPPLSFAQERLWLLDQLDPGNVAYNLPTRLRLSGPLDVAALERAIRAIVRRHEVLRTTFAAPAGEPVQVVHEDADVALPVEDLPAGARVEDVALAETARPFDLARGPLLRARLVRVTDDDHLLLLTLHHIAGDGWSKGVFFRELSALYGAFREGRPSPLPDLAIQYADHAAWQRAWLTGEALERQLAYWKEALAGAPAATDLPTDRPRPPVQTTRGARRRFAIPADLSNAVRALARREGTTLFMTLLAAFAALLARHGAGDDLVVGTPVAGRTRPEVEPLVGFFVNTLALRARIEPGSTFLDLLARVRETCLGAYAHQDVPFERLVSDLAKDRDPSRTPIFQVVFTLEDAAPDPLRLPGLSVSGVAAEATTAKFDLTMALCDAPGGLLGSLEHNTDLFDAETADRMIARYRTLLESALSAPATPVGDLAILPDAERRQIAAWSALAAAEPPRACLHALFEAQVDATPGAPAVTFEGESLTYADLDARANRIAHRLRALGVGPGTLVGLCLPRSAELVAAMIGILKAGGAYLPLDPEYPADRLAFMVADAGAPVVVTRADLAPGLPDGGAPSVRLDADAGALAGEPAHRPASGARPSDLAYVIYTSGSTGKPKGVMIDHASVARLFSAARTCFRFGTGDVWTLFHSYAFDFSVWEIWGALLHGGRVVVVPRAVTRAPDAFHALLAGEGVTVLSQTPSAFRQLVQAEAGMGEARRPLALRYVVFGGEALDVRDLGPWWDLHGDERPELVNMYGITETTVHVTWRPLRRRDLDRPWSSAIGRPLPDLSMHVLDARGEPAPIGVPGEIHVGGAGVARGYLRRPALTAERFLPDPRGGGARLYRTGDRARLLGSGDVEYLGRLDQQVKIRGHRIELGEIEAVMGQHPAARAAVVTARDEGAHGDRRLVAYLVLREGAPAPTVQDLRAFAQRQLPDPMVPAAFVLIDALPLTEHGKVDRRALPAPEEGDRPDLGEAFAAPRTAVEEALARIWAGVLRVPKVGVHDNFFALGGDSILSIQIVSRARQAGLSISPRQLFQHQTVADLAGAMGEEEAAPADEGEASGPVPLTPIQRWWLEGDPIDPDHHNQSFFLEARERIDPGALEAAIGALIAHHDALRLRLRRDAGGWRASIVEASGPVPIARVDLRDVPDPDLAARIEEGAAAAQASLSLAEGPIVRVVCFDPGEPRPARILIVIHHVAVDGVSWRILVEDLWTAYAQARRGEAIALPARTLSWKRWAEQLVDHARSAAIAGEVARWTAGVRGPARGVPVDHDRGDDTEASARSVAVQLSAEETAQLLRDVPGAYHTQITEVLLAAFAQAAAPWIGSSAVLVDLEGHGREDVIPGADVTRTVGWFTALYPVVIDAGNGGPGEALKAVKEQVRAVPGRGIGYGLLRYLRDGDPAAGAIRALPQPGISFNYLGQLDQAVPEDAPFRRAREHAGPPRSPRARRRHLVDVNGSVLGGRLGVRFTYSEHRHRRETIEALAARFLRSLRDLIAHAASPSAGGYTPSDFPLARLGQAAIDRIAAAAGGRGAVEDVYPLTPLQEGILFHVLSASQPGVYFVQLAWTLAGALDVPAFVQAWQAVVDRHAALRTAVLWDRLDAPVQLVQARAAIDAEVLDLRDLAPDERQAAALRFAEDDRRRGFDLSRAPLTRIALLRMGEDTWRFVWSAHHVALDGWSMPILLGEALARYAARVRGEDLRLDAARPFGDYVRWLATQDPDRSASFWRAELADVVAPTPLPREPALGDPRFAERRVRLSGDASAALSAFARRHRITASTLVHGAWALLLSRYSGEEDVVFGSTVSGRSAPVQGIDRMVGLFINTLPVRARVRPDEPAAAFFAGLLERQAALRDHEASALAAVQALSGVPRGTPLFESLVVFENQPLEEAPQGGAGGLAITDARAFERPPYPLTLQASLRGSLLLRVGFDAARFEEPLVERMLGHLTTLLAAVAEAPSRPVAALPILTAAEREQILVAWNDTAHAYATDRLVHELVAAQAARTPDAVAVVFEDAAITYGAFADRVNRLAHALRERGVGPEVIVGVLFERSIEMVIAIHAVLAAGGAYLPIDPDHPKDRIAFVIDDARPPVILAQARLAAGLPPCSAAVIRLDEAWEALVAGEPSGAPDRAGLGLASLAYVIYTSGSTGRPKGVMSTHGGLLNRLLWMQHAHALAPADRVMQKTPYGFDVSVWELFWPLLAGARLVVARPSGHRDPGYLAGAVDAESVTTIHFVPSMLGPFLDHADPARCRSLRRVFASGEALPPALADRFFARLPGAALHNLYGPTEAAVDVTAWACRPGASTVPIGRPIHNVRIHLLDERLDPVPEGIRGEIAIGGVQVGRGYLGRPDLTAERFVPDPWSEGRTLYRTGDLGRLLPSGDVEYLGRADFQVKIRGHRIELGEIEAHLLGHPAVREAVVVARDAGSGEDRRLVAYLACAEGPRPGAGELRSFLRETLPEAMVPSLFVLLDHLPLTASGKVDRRALPAPEAAERAGTGEDHVAPSSAVEQELARIWASVLRVDRVSVHDDFFALGGDSILSIQIISRARAAGIEITIRQIFEHPTIAALGAVAGARRGVDAEQGPVTGPVPLTPVERWWLDRGPVDASHWNQSVFLDLREPADAAALEGALAAVLAHHDALRLRLVRTDRGWAQAIAAPGAAARVRRVDLAGVPMRDRAPAIEAAATEAQASLDLAEGPIVRAVLFDLGDAGQRLLLVIHHVAVDGVSWRILLEDLWAAYQAARRGEAARLPPKTTSFKRWAERLADHARSEETAREAAHWLGLGQRRVAPLPADRRGGEETEASTRSVVVSLDAAETGQLLREAPEAYATRIDDLLLTALAQAVSAWTGASRVLVDLEGHGREEIAPGEDVDVTRTVGWFTAVYPVILELPAAGGLAATIKSIKEQLRAVPGRGVGWGLLRYLREGDAIGDAIRALPEAEISFNDLGRVDQALPEDEGPGPFRWAREPGGPPRSPRARRRYAIDVSTRVVGGRLHVWVSYSDRRYERATMEALAGGLLRALRAVVAHCASPEARGHTPSDFQDAALSQRDLDWLVGMVAGDQS